MNKILIIDDDRELCALIKRSVQAENIEADFCNTGKDGLQKLKEQEYQLVVLDVMMPGMDGFETLEEIRKENSLPILMFTSKNDSISKVRGLRAGADDYLTKPFDMDELIARIASLIRRYTRFNQQAGAIQKLNFDGLQIDLENRSVTTENGTFELPPKEFDLLLYCAKHQGKILTKQQIYEEVWGEEYFYDDSNIMAIISRLRKKLEVNPSSPKYIQMPAMKWPTSGGSPGTRHSILWTAMTGLNIPLACMSRPRRNSLNGWKPFFVCGTLSIPCRRFRAVELTHISFLASRLRKLPRPRAYMRSLFASRSSVALNA